MKDDRVAPAESGVERSGQGIASGWSIQDAGSTGRGFAGSKRPVKRRAEKSVVSQEPGELPGENAHSDTAGNDIETVSAMQLSNSALAILGVIGGLMLIYTWGWFVIANYYTNVNAATAAGSGIVGGVLQTVYFWAAVPAPGLWFLTVFFMHRKAGVSKLALWLFIGALALLPWPLLIGGGR